GFAAKSVGDGSVEERRHGEADHKSTHRQAYIRGACAKRGAGRCKSRQIDVDAGIRHGREKAEQQREGKGDRLYLHGANVRNVFRCFQRRGRATPPPSTGHDLIAAGRRRDRPDWPSSWRSATWVL